MVTIIKLFSELKVEGFFPTWNIKNVHFTPVFDYRVLNFCESNLSVWFFLKGEEMSRWIVVRRWFENNHAFLELGQFNFELLHDVFHQVGSWWFVRGAVLHWWGRRSCVNTITDVKAEVLEDGACQYQMGSFGASVILEHPIKKYSWQNSSWILLLGERRVTNWSKGRWIEELRIRMRLRNISWFLLWCDFNLFIEVLKEKVALLNVWR